MNAVTQLASLPLEKLLKLNGGTIRLGEHPSKTGCSATGLSTLKIEKSHQSAIKAMNSSIKKMNQTKPHEESLMKKFA